MVLVDGRARQSVSLEAPVKAVKLAPRQAVDTDFPKGWLDCFGHYAPVLLNCVGRAPWRNVVEPVIYQLAQRAS